MARAKRRQRSTNGLHMPFVDDVEKTLDKMMGSAETVAQTAVQWVHSFLTWLKRHKKLAVLIVLGVLAYNYLMASNGSEEEVDEDDEEDYDD